MTEEYDIIATETKQQVQAERKAAITKIQTEIQLP